MYLFLAALVLRCSALAFSLAAVSKVYPSASVAIGWYLYLYSMVLRVCRLCSCSMQALGVGLSSWRCTGLYVESSGTRDWTCVLCLARQTHPLGHPGRSDLFLLIHSLQFIPPGCTIPLFPTHERLKVLCVTSAVVLRKPESLNSSPGTATHQLWVLQQARSFLSEAPLPSCFEY